jgi:hypothetical protein
MADEESLLSAGTVFLLQAGSDDRFEIGKRNYSVGVISINIEGGFYDQPGGYQGI